MKFEAKEIRLKDERTAVFRSPDPGEAREMLDYLKDCASERHFILRYPEECVETEEQEAAYLEGLNRDENKLMIVCDVDGKLAGNCMLSFNSRIKTKHKASVAIGLRQKYWNLGIGTAMFREMIGIAESRGVLQLELSYLEGNDRGKRLYEKMGFVQTAEHPDAFRLKDGSLLKEIFMMRKL